MRRLPLTNQSDTFAIIIPINARVYANTHVPTMQRDPASIVFLVTVKPVLCGHSKLDKKLN